MSLFKIIVCILWFVLGAGWGTNVFNLVSAAFSGASFTVLNMLQLIGIPLGPLGSFLGIYSWFI